VFLSFYMLPYFIIYVTLNFSVIFGLRVQRVALAAMIILE